jgi:hypothetical protein
LHFLEKRYFYGNRLNYLAIIQVLLNNTFKFDTRVCIPNDGFKSKIVQKIVLMKDGYWSNSNSIKPVNKIELNMSLSGEGN